jgi:hypothetical protein
MIPMTDQTHTPGVGYFTCAYCGTDKPHDGKPHQCDPPANVKRHLERSKQQQAAAEKARTAPRRCDGGCGQMVTPGSSHWCTFPPDPASEAIRAVQLAGLAQTLKDAGIDVPAKSS